MDYRPVKANMNPFPSGCKPNCWRAASDETSMHRKCPALMKDNVWGNTDRLSLILVKKCRWFNHSVQSHTGFVICLYCHIVAKLHFYSVKKNSFICKPLHLIKNKHVNIYHFIIKHIWLNCSPHHAARYWWLRLNTRFHIFQMCMQTAVCCVKIHWELSRK